jgi:hypothetical protein
MSNFHIIPAAGSASRIGGLPKYLLPVGKLALPLLFFHIKMAQNCNYPVRIAVHPSLAEYISELCLNWGFIDAKVISIQSKTMTETCLHMTSDLPESATVTISMPDTFYTQMNSIDTLTSLIKLQEIAPSLALWKIQASQIGKLGQVEIDASASKIMRIVDKDLSCTFESSWGMIALPLSILRTFSILDPAIGMSLEKLISVGLNLNYLEIPGKYFDCGTITEYREALNWSLM